MQELIQTTDLVGYLASQPIYSLKPGLSRCVCQFISIQSLDWFLALDAAILTDLKRLFRQDRLAGNNNQALHHHICILRSLAVLQLRKRHYRLLFTQWKSRSHETNGRSVRTNRTRALQDKVL